jgi:signal transduction histidine kinase
MKSSSSSHTEVRLLRRLQWRLALGFAVAFVVFDLIVVGLTYVVLDYHFTQEAKAAIQLTWQQESPPKSHDRDHLPLPPKLPSGSVLPGEELPRVATWHFNARSHLVSGSNLLYGLPVAVKTLLPNQRLLAQMRHTKTPLWQVVNTQQYRVLVGSKPLWSGPRYLGAEQSIYSMGRVSNLMAGLLVVDLELSAVAIALIMLLAFWLSGRSLAPIRYALKRQRDFIHDVSHELRTPLTIVKSGLELALGEADRAEVDQAIKNSLQEVDYVTRLMGDLATLARIDSGTTLVEPEVFDIFLLAREVVDGLAPLARERGIDLSVDTSGADGQVLGDPIQIRQLLLILLDNALKYNHVGGFASLSLSAGPMVVQVTVKDSGPGIPAQDLPHIFDRFYRSRSTTLLAPGSGLGLAIAQWAAEAHRGHIRVESQVGQGTTVYVEWPRRWEG